ncbi:MAG: alpha/beta hydrolase [Anaerolineae bacterium]|nr:alpha/beta hydrolase [Anaerolineae bacterium]
MTTTTFSHQRENLLQFQAEHPCQKITVANVQWEYLVGGKGPETLLFLNGGLRIAETAFAYVQLFEPAYRVIVPTYPPLWHIDEIVDGIVAILEQEQIQNVFVLGQSYGGMVAQVMVQRYPARIKKLVLSSAGPLSAPRLQRAALTLILALAPMLPGKMVKNIYQKSIFQILSVPGNQRDFWQVYLAQIFEKRLSKADVLSHFRTGADTLKKYGYDQVGGKPWPGEVLVIGGENDPVSTEADRTKIVAFYPNTRLKIVADAGHAIVLSKPNEYAASIKTFFAQN